MLGVSCGKKWGGGLQKVKICKTNAKKNLAIKKLQKIYIYFHAKTQVASLKTIQKKVQNISEETVVELVRIQEMLEDYMLPRINNAINAYEKIIGSGFIYEITGEMQGDGNHESIYMDDGIFYATSMLLHFIRANIYSIIAYDINIPYGTMDFLEELLPDEQIDLSGSEDLINSYMYLRQDSDFLTLRNRH